MGKDINRIKVMLVEKKRTNKWLAEQLGKDTLLRIAELLDVQIQELVRMPE